MAWIFRNSSTLKAFSQEFPSLGAIPPFTVTRFTAPSAKDVKARRHENTAKNETHPRLLFLIIIAVPPSAEFVASETDRDRLLAEE